MPFCTIEYICDPLFLPLSTPPLTSLKHHTTILYLSHNVPSYIKKMSDLVMKTVRDVDKYEESSFLSKRARNDSHRPKKGGI